MKPWTEGPLELLKHGQDHLKLNTDFDYRIAMISIDNSVELMIKTFLGLPRRVTGITGFSRKKRAEAFESFSATLDALEEFAPDKTVGIELSDIEWYHRLRNQLYHDGNGITVEKVRVEAYYEIAGILFKNLFGELVQNSLPPISPTEMGNLVLEWSKLEQAILKLQALHNISDNATFQYIIEYLADQKVIPSDAVSEFLEVRQMRNKLVHGVDTPSNTDVNKARSLLKKLLKALEIAISIETI